MSRGLLCLILPDFSARWCCPISRENLAAPVTIMPSTAFHRVNFVCLVMPACGALEVIIFPSLLVYCFILREIRRDMYSPRQLYIWNVRSTYLRENFLTLGLLRNAKFRLCFANHILSFLENTIKLRPSSLWEMEAVNCCVYTYFDSGFRL